MTFATEAERLKAREVYAATEVAIMAVLGLRSTLEEQGEYFDRAFPPIKPPKMVPFEAWVALDERGKCYNIAWGKNHPVAPKEYRVVRVRVVEVDDE